MDWMLLENLWKLKTVFERSLLVGSRAAKYHFEDFRDDTNSDYDFWGCSDTHAKTSGERVEYKNVSQYPGLLKAFNEEYDRSGTIASPRFLYTLKISHSFWLPRKFAKTMHDILFFQEKGVEFDDDLFKLLYADWVLIHGKKRANLNKTKAEFFSDNVKRVYHHDAVHESIMYGSRPMYFEIHKDGAEVLTDKKKFDNLSYEDKLKVVREEVYTTALERFLIPSDFKESPLIAYRNACRLLVTSMTSGWFPKFIVLNWSELHLPDKSYQDEFQKRIDRTRIVGVN